jgi:uncharacterized RDD family membrane protein YckC
VYTGGERPRPRIVSVEVSPATPSRGAPSEPRLGAPRQRLVVGNPLAYVLARFCAFVVDLVVLTIVATEFSYGAIAINPFTGLPTNTEGGFDGTLALGCGIALISVWLAEGLLGTTLGKLAFGLHVFPVRGRAVGLGRSLMRNVLRPLDLLVIGAILALLPARRRLGDLLGGTVVARSPLGSRGSAIGIVALLVLLGLPFVVLGVGRTFAAMFAFVEFVPRLVAHGWEAVRRMVAG